VHDEKVEAINSLLQTIKLIAEQYNIQKGGSLLGLITGLMLDINLTFADNIREVRITRMDKSQYWSIKYHPESFTVLDNTAFNVVGEHTGEGQIFFSTNRNFLTAIPDAADQLSQVKNWKHI